MYKISSLLKREFESTQMILTKNKFKIIIHRYIGARARDVNRKKKT